jgi:hypothetical protein
MINKIGKGPFTLHLEGINCIEKSLDMQVSVLIGNAYLLLHNGFRSAYNVRQEGQKYI